LVNDARNEPVIALLGDSVFDNGAYVGGAPDVAEQLRGCLPAGNGVVLAAVDGSRIEQVRGQLERLSSDVNHLVVSTGGNDALDHIGLFAERVDSIAEALARLGDASSTFEFKYRRMLEAMRASGLPTAVCTIYFPQFPEAALQTVAVAALAHFNDCILREAFRAGVPVLDLRLICSDPRDYANPIEPSARGGQKIAEAIARLVREHDFSVRRSTVYV
jgi:hypothetical protein